MSTAPALWKELCGLLHDRGVLPFEASVMTPAEVAEAVARANGDPRPRNFVWQYLYPRHYGGMEADLSETDAAALVESFKARPEPAAPERHGPSCGICHKRPARGET